MADAHDGGDEEVRPSPDRCRGGRFEYRRGSLGSDDFHDCTQSPAVVELLSNMQEKLDECENTIRKLREELERVKRTHSENSSKDEAAESGHEAREVGEIIADGSRSKLGRDASSDLRSTLPESGREMQEGEEKNARGSRTEKSAKLRGEGKGEEDKSARESQKRRRHGAKKKKKHKKKGRDSEGQREAIDSFMASVKQGKSSAEGWEKLVRAIQGENRHNYKEKLHEVLEKQRSQGEDWTERGTTASCPEIGQKFNDSRDESEDENMRATTNLDGSGGGPSSVPETDNKEGARPRDFFAAEGYSPSTARLVQRMESLDVEDDYSSEDDEYIAPLKDFEDERARWEDDEKVKEDSPRSLFAKAQSPSTALLIDRMEKLSEELLVEVDHWDSDEDDDDTLEPLAPPLPEKERPKMVRGQSRSTILLMQRMEELNDELAAEMGNLKGGSPGNGALPATRTTMSRSSRPPRSTVGLVDRMENLGDVLDVKNVAGLDGTRTTMSRSSRPPRSTLGLVDRMEHLGDVLDVKNVTGLDDIAEEK